MTCSAENISGGQSIQKTFPRQNGQRAVLQFRWAGVNSKTRLNNTIRDQRLQWIAELAAPARRRFDFNADGALAASPDEVDFAARRCTPVAQLAAEILK